MFGMGNGMNGWEGYQLGRRSVATEQMVEQFTANLRARFSRAPTIDINAVMANNQALAAQNQALRTQVDELERVYNSVIHRFNTLAEDYRHLDTWADEAAAKLQELGLIKPRE